MEDLPDPSCETEQIIRDSLFVNNDSDIESDDDLLSDF